MFSKILFAAMIAFVAADNQIGLWGFPTNNIRVCTVDEDCSTFGDTGSTCGPLGKCQCSGTGTYEHKTFWGRTLFTCGITTETEAVYRERTIDTIMTFTFPQATCANLTSTALQTRFNSVFNTLLTSKVNNIVYHCEPSNVMVRAVLFVDEVYNIMPRIGSDLEWALLQDSERLVDGEAVSFMRQQLGPMDHSLTHVTTAAGAANLCSGNLVNGSTLTVRTAGKCRAMFCQQEVQTVGTPALYLNHNGNCVLRPVLPAEENRGWTTGIIIAVSLGGILACIIFVGLIFVCCLGENEIEETEKTETA